jgi:hypothetical protein
LAWRKHKSMRFGFNIKKASVEGGVMCMTEGQPIAPVIGTRKSFASNVRRHDQLRMCDRANGTSTAIMLQ